MHSKMSLMCKIGCCVCSKLLGFFPVVVCYLSTGIALTESLGGGVDASRWGLMSSYFLVILLMHLYHNDIFCGYTGGA